MEEERANTIPELLAPAGSMAALVAAVNAGADAVYLSGKEYGARKYAENFSLPGIADAIEFAHMHGVGVHVTVNTLVHDDELAGAARYVADLYSIGVDAVIVQDVGLARMIRDIVPDLPLHASTQATIYSREGVLWAKKAGFERVILARETTLSELDRILALDPKMRPEIEIFVHGALCYCFSGQCLLSSAIGGRSGNRGMCAQPCRKPYSLLGAAIDRYGRPVGAENVPMDIRYLLSTRDLMLYPFLGEITRRDIAALKVEGRMRSPEYVGTVVSAYRNALDRIIEGAWTPSTEDMDDMSIIFSRGFTGGYLAGETGTRLMGRERPDNRGLFFGEVVSCDPALGRFSVVPKHGYVPVKGDGIAVEDPRSGMISGYTLTQDGMLHGNRLVISMTGLPRMIRCRKGLLVYVTSSPGIGKRAQVRTVSCRFRIPLDLSLDLSPDSPPVLEGIIHTGSGDIVVVRRADFVPERARTAPLSQSQVEEQLRKTGDPIFEIRDCSINYNGDLFIPLGELNRFRRDFYAKVRQEFLDQFRPGGAETAAVARRLESVKCAPGAGAGVRRVPGDLPVISVYVDSVASARGACESGCRT
ncbi:MAG TPA: U32 family peptidase, partial [Methanolinea sp.]|nr:U32 family peptidase [Methanolinea sp.]